MRNAKVRDVVEWLNAIAPFETAESYDNVGLLVGSMETPLRNVMVVLDATLPVIEEALRRDAQLIVAHHPLMFRPIQRILTDEYEGKVLAALLKHGIALVAAHTNMDKTAFSGSARLAEKLALGSVTHAGEYLFLVEMQTPLSALQLEETLQEKMGRKIIRCGAPDVRVSRLAVGGGACDDAYAEAASLGAQALLTGEVRHHNALAAAQSGMVLFEGGHFDTEAPMVPCLAEGLQKALDGLEYHTGVFCHQGSAY